MAESLKIVLTGNSGPGGGASMTAAEILAALLTVDGSGSGLDADLLDGQSSAAFAPSTVVTTHVAATDPHGDRAYTDAQIAAMLTSAFDFKASVKAATTANITLSGTQTIDGVSIGAGDRVLVKDQSTGSQNGIYVAAAGAWARSTDADVSAEVTAGLAVPVEQGTANGGRLYMLTTSGTITLGTTALTFTRIDAGTLVASNNLSDVTNAANARSNLGVAIGSQVQGYSVRLADLAAITPSQGDVIYYNGTAWVRLAAGTSGQFFQTQGAGANPQWATASGGGTNVPAVNTSLASAAPGMIRLSFANSMVTLTSGVTYYTGPFELDAAAALTGFQFKIDALTGTANLRIALVSVDPVDLQPLALTYAVAEQTYTTTGEKKPTFSSQSIPAGVYYVAFRTDNSTLAFAGMRMGPASGWRGDEEGYKTASHFTVSEAYDAFSSPPTDWTASVKVSTTGTTGLLIPITWVVS